MRRTPLRNRQLEAKHEIRSQQVLPTTRRDHRVIERRMLTSIAALVASWAAPAEAQVLLEAEVVAPSARPPIVVPPPPSAPIVVPPPPPPPPVVVVPAPPGAQVTVDGTVTITPPVVVPPRVDVAIEIPSPPSIEISTPPPAVTIETTETTTTTTTATSSAFVPGTIDIDVGLHLLLDMQFGATWMDPAVDANTFGFGMQLDLDIAEWFALGARFGVTTRRGRAIDVDVNGIPDVPLEGVTTLAFSAGPRFYVPFDHETRDRLSIELGGGYLVQDGGTRPNGAFAEIALGLIADGRIDGDRDGVAGGPSLRFQQGFGDAGSYRALLFGYQGGFDFGAPRPRERRPAAGFRYTFGFDVGLGVAPLGQGSLDGGVSLSIGTRFGIPVTDWLEPTARIDFTARGRGVDFGGLDVYAGALGLRFLFDPWAVAYAEVLGGVGAATGSYANQVPGLWFVDVGAGLRFAGCGDDQIAGHVGLRSRIGVDRDDAFTAFYLELGVEHDSLPPGMRRERCQPRVVQPEPVPEVVVVTTPSPSAPPRPTPPPVVVDTSTRTVPVQEETVVVSGGGEVSVPSGPVRVPLVFGAHFGLGVTDSTLSLDGFTQEVGVRAGVWFLPEFSLDGEITYMSSPDEARDRIAPSYVDDIESAGFEGWFLGGGPTFRVFTDLEHRSGWVFGARAGFATINGSEARLDPSGATFYQNVPWRDGGYVEALLGHQIGVRGGGGEAFDLSVELRYRQGLGSLFDTRALMLTLSGLIETATDPSEPSGRDADFSYRLALTGFFGAGLSSPFGSGTGGARAAFGLPIGTFLEPRVAVDLLIRGDAEDMPASPTFGVMGGLRLLLDEVFPMYIDAHAGYARHYDTLGERSPGGAVLETGIGARFGECSGGSDTSFEIGGALRLGLEGNRVDDGIFFTLGAVYGGGPALLGRDARAHCRFAPPSTTTTSTTTTIVTPPTEVETYVPDPLTAPPGIVVPPPPSIEVVVPSAEVVVVPPPVVAPLEIEVVIGVSLPATGWTVMLDPAVIASLATYRGIPIDVELRAAPWVRVEAEATLRQAFATHGLTLHSIATVEVMDPTVRAVLRIAR